MFTHSTKLYVYPLILQYWLMVTIISPETCSIEIWSWYSNFMFLTGIYFKLNNRERLGSKWPSFSTGTWPIVLLLSQPLLGRHWVAFWPYVIAIYAVYSLRGMALSLKSNFSLLLQKHTNTNKTLWTYFFNISVKMVSTSFMFEFWISNHDNDHSWLFYIF